MADVRAVYAPDGAEFASTLAKSLASEDPNKRVVLVDLTDRASCTSHLLPKQRLDQAFLSSHTFPHSWWKYASQEKPSEPPKLEGEDLVQVEKNFWAAVGSGSDVLNRAVENLCAAPGKEGLLKSYVDARFSKEAVAVVLLVVDCAVENRLLQLVLAASRSVIRCAAGKSLDGGVSGGPLALLGEAAQLPRMPGLKDAEGVLLMHRLEPNASLPSFFLREVMDSKQTPYSLFTSSTAILFCLHGKASEVMRPTVRELVLEGLRAQWNDYSKATLKAFVTIFPSPEALEDVFEVPAPEQEKKDETGSDKKKKRKSSTSSTPPSTPTQTQDTPAKRTRSSSKTEEGTNGEIPSPEKPEDGPPDSPVDANRTPESRQPQKTYAKVDRPKSLSIDPKKDWRGNLERIREGTLSQSETPWTYGHLAPMRDYIRAVLNRFDKEVPSAVKKNLEKRISEWKDWNKNLKGFRETVLEALD